MDDIIKEIIEFGNCSSIGEFNNAINKMVLLFNNCDDKNNILLKEYINELMNVSYKQYIENIINTHYKNIKREQDYKNNVPNQYYPMNIISKYNSIIVKDMSSKVLMKTLIVSEDTIINDKKRISAYSILKAYFNNKLLKHNDIIDVSNINVLCYNIIDYASCYVLLLNILYSNCFDGNVIDKINSILIMNNNIVYNDLRNNNTKIQTLTTYNKTNDDTNIIDKTNVNKANVVQPCNTTNNTNIMNKTSVVQPCNTTNNTNIMNKTSVGQAYIKNKYMSSNVKTTNDYIQLSKQKIFSKTELNNNENNILTNTYKTCIYITNSITHGCFINIMELFKFDVLYCYFQLEELTNINETSYKQIILSKLTPKIVFDINTITDINNKNCLNTYILYKCKHVSSNYFSIKHKNGNEKNLTDDNIIDNKNIIYSFNSDWLSNKQINKTSNNNELFKELKLFELTTKYNYEKMRILHNYNEPMFNNDFDTYFKYLDIDKSILSRVSYRKIKLSDYLDHYKTSNVKTKLKYTKEGIYPLISSINHDNGITSFVDKYDTECNDDNKIMSIGLRKKGKCCAFVHNYNFAHVQEVALFKLKKHSSNPEIAYVLNNNIINIYNIAFSINQYNNNNNINDDIKNKNDINVKDILSLEINVIYIDHNKHNV